MSLDSGAGAAEEEMYGRAGGPDEVPSAKEVLGGHMCIRGGVPSSMFINDSYEAVNEHCRRVIKEVGGDGFILSAECQVPHDAKFETVKAMVDAARG